MLKTTLKLLDLFCGAGKPYIIENVPGAPLENPIRLCGTMFPGLRVIRHRLFECNPWLDAPPESLIVGELHRSDHNRLLRYIERDYFIAIQAVGQRGMRSKGCRLDGNGEPIVTYKYAPRRPEKYLSKIEIKWLKEFSEESYRYTDAIALIAAIAEYFQRLSRKLATASRPKKRIKAKERRARERGL